MFIKFIGNLVYNRLFVIKSIVSVFVLRICEELKIYLNYKIFMLFRSCLLVKVSL